MKLATLIKQFEPNTRIRLLGSDETVLYEGIFRNIKYYYLSKTIDNAQAKNGVMIVAIKDKKTKHEVESGANYYEWGTDEFNDDVKEVCKRILVDYTTLGQFAIDDENKALKRWLAYKEKSKPDGKDVERWYDAVSDYKDYDQSFKNIEIVSSTQVDVENKKYTADIMNGTLYIVKQYLSKNLNDEEIKELLKGIDENDKEPQITLLKKNGRYPDNHVLAKLLLGFLNIYHTKGNMSLAYYNQGGNGYDGWDYKLFKLKKEIPFEEFKNYIDKCYMKDYVDENYNIIRIKDRKVLCDDEDVNKEKFAPENEEQLQLFLENVISLILVRGIRIECEYKGVIDESLAQENDNYDAIMFVQEVLSNAKHKAMWQF